jgi:hypothetical protein
MAPSFTRKSVRSSRLSVTAHADRLGLGVFIPDNRFFSSFAEHPVPLSKVLGVYKKRAEFLFMTVQILPMLFEGLPVQATREALAVSHKIGNLSKESSTFRAQPRTFFWFPHHGILFSDRADRTDPILGDQCDERLSAQNTVRCRAEAHLGRQRANTMGR